MSYDDHMIIISYFSKQITTDNYYHNKNSDQSQALKTHCLNYKDDELF